MNMTLWWSDCLTGKSGDKRTKSSCNGQQISGLHRGVGADRRHRPLRCVPANLLQAPLHRHAPSPALLHPLLLISCVLTAHSLMEHGHSAQSEPSAGIPGHDSGGQAYERPSGCNHRAELMRGIRRGGCAIGCTTRAVDKTAARITVAGVMDFHAVTEHWSCSDQVSWRCPAIFSRSPTISRFCWRVVRVNLTNHTCTNTWTDTGCIIHSIPFCHVCVDDLPLSSLDPTYDCE
ncbi:hypothetical protein BJX96DRAFT_2382 [Aspergillus floccosus]